MLFPSLCIAVHVAAGTRCPSMAAAGKRRFRGGPCLRKAVPWGVSLKPPRDSLGAPSPPVFPCPCLFLLVGTVLGWAVTFFFLFGGIALRDINALGGEIQILNIPRFSRWTAEKRRDWGINTHARKKKRFEGKPGTKRKGKG